MKKITKEEHKQRHIELHKSLDELFADYIGHHGNDVDFLNTPLKKLMDWSYEQSMSPTDL